MSKTSLILPLITLVCGIILVVNKDINTGLLFIIIAFLQYIVYQNNNKPSSPPCKFTTSEGQRLNRERYLN